jgi:hypothetical protein
VDYNTVVQELADRKAAYLGTRQIDGVTFKVYRVGTEALQPELVAINDESKVVARGATLAHVIAVKNGAQPTDPPVVVSARPSVLPPTGPKPPLI